MKKHALIFITLCINLAISAQGQKINTLSFDTLYYAGINPAGELYTVSPNKITRFDKDGHIMKELVLPSTANISQFDSWHLTQLILYYRHKQLIEIYNPKLDLQNSFTIDSVFAIEPEFVAPSFDQKHFWIFDKADGSLKKVNYTTEEVTVDEVITVFDTQQIPVLSMREYQHFLFLQTSTTLYVFNSMGKHIHNFEAVENFDFFGEELFFISPNELRLISLFTMEKRFVTVDGPFERVLLTDDRLFGITKNTLKIFGFSLN